MSTDMKHGLTSDRPRLTITPRTAQVYTTRALEYGADKYRRGNYHAPPPPHVSEVERLLGYLDAAIRHASEVADRINRAIGAGGDPELLRAACAAADDVASGNFPASGLPHLAHALASLSIGVTCAADAGLLPTDPGQPWRAGERSEALAQKDDPAAERARVDALTAGANHLPAEMASSLLLAASTNRGGTNVAARVVDCGTGYRITKGAVGLGVVGGLAADLTPGASDGAA